MSTKYFNQFPKLLYDIDGKGINFKLVTDIWRRIKMREELKDNIALFAKYNVPNGETPEVTSFKHFGSPDYFWIVLITNNMTDRFHDWPMSNLQFEDYVKEKYTNPGAIHHYEIAQSSGPTTSNGPNDYEHLIEVTADTVGAASVSNYDYEMRLQDKKREIKLVDQRYLPLFLEEFESLVRR